MTTERVRMHRWMLSAVLLLLACGCSREQAPDPVEQDPMGSMAGVTVLERGADCATCEIVLEELVVLGTLEDSIPIGGASTLAVVPNGACIVGPTDQDGELLRFDDCTGQPRPIGRQGEGPGGLGSIRAIAGWQGDSVLAFGYGTMTVVSAASGAGRTTRFDPVVEGHEILALPADSTVIVNAGSPTAPQFSALRSDGGIVRQFGMQADAATRVDHQLHARVLGTSPEPGRFWAGTNFYHYQLERLNTQGERDLTIDRSPSWFPSYDAAELDRYWAASATVVRPLPYLRALRETADGLLWTTFAVAARDWQPDSVSAPTRRTRNGEVPGRSLTRLDHYDGVLEVLDPHSGELLVSIQTPDMWVGFANDTLVYARRTGTDGITQLALYRYRLRR